MKRLLIVFIVALVSVSCGKKKNNDDYELNGLFEIRENDCSGGQQPVPRRVMKFIQSSDTSMTIEYIEKQGDPGFKRQTLKAHYRKYDNREFSLETDITGCRIIIEGTFIEKNDFHGEWNETCPDHQCECRIEGTGL